ncbi:PKD domain-containing protein [Psychroserpens sp. AS72]|uniref:PKD domain-containing protein n=1 Tax=Psychroserpens sp. AS72 TaxID=3135775 RepID=UPI00317C1BE2
MIKKYPLLLFVSCFLLSITYAHVIHKKQSEYTNNVKLNVDTSLAVSDATISISATQICQYDTPAPIVTFTGSGGSTPYTFTYDINNGADQTITTNGNNNSISVAVNTNNSGTFTYNLISVEDDTGTVDPITGSSVQIQILPSPDTSMGGTGAGTTFEGVPVFRDCTNVTTTFTFTNTSTTGALNTNYHISWGDGSPDFDQTTWGSTTHTYDVGIYNLVYTIEASNGCDRTTNYIVFVGSNPAVSLGNPGNTDICNSSPLTFPITGTDNNPPGTTYTVTFNDGSAPQTFSHPPPTSITHTFATSSCNTTSSDGTNSYQNSFSAIIVASNPCSASSVGVVPIYVSIAPEADFDAPENACVNTQICLTNTSIGEENNGLGSSCDTSPNIIWDISPATGYTVTSGDLGNDFGLSDPNLWVSGTDNLCLNFTQLGTYTVTLNTGNRCGADTIVKTICVEDDLVPVFSTSTSEGCGPLNITTSNTTDESTSCETPEYLWEVNYTADNCGTAPGQWSFTNGTDENSASPSFSFDTSGTYEIVLTATNSCGDFTTSQSIEVKQPPEVTINDIDDECGAADINPTAVVDTCAPASETIIYNWSFPGGTPASANTLDPGTINYAAVGSYTITLSVTNDCGTETVTETFDINEAPVITNTDLNQTICSGATTTAINLISNNTTTTYTWMSNDPVGLAGYFSSGINDEIPAQTLINLTNAPITLIYTVVPEIAGCEGDPVIFEIIVEPAPLVTVQPISDEICLNGTTPDLTVSYQGVGTPNYQWYQNTVNNTSTGTAIAGATSQTFSPPTDTVGDIYYYVVITFSTGGCNEITSDAALIEVKDVSQIDTEPVNTQSICVDGIADELSVIVSGGAGSPTYQWFSNTTNSNTGGTLIPGATNSTYTPPVFTVIGTYYYYVEISYGANGCSNLLSSISEVIVVEDPVVDTLPIATQSLCQSTIPTDLEVIVFGGLGTISYQWYTNTTNSTIGGTAIVGETSSTFTPPTTGVGTFYYYCIITQDVSGCEVVSLVGEVEVTAAAQFTNQPLSDELCLGETTADLIVAYTNGTGSPSYQWYENTVSDVTSGTVIAGATTATYSPDVSAVGTTYYYCIITLDAGGCSEIVSEVAEIIVNETPYISDGTELICSGTLFEHIPDETNGDSVPTNTLYTWTTPIVTPAGSITGASEELVGQTSISQLLVNTTINPGTVTYTVTPTSGNCIGADFEVVVTVNPSISVTSQVTNNSCFESNDASIEITIVGGVPFSTGNPYNISWTGPNAFTSTDEDIFNLAEGTYTLEIIDDGGCPYSETFTITEPDILEFSTVTFDPETISCFGADDGEIGIDVIGGTFPYTYNWTLNGSPFSADEDLENLGPGEYIVSISDDNNCGPITQTFTIVEPDVLSVTLDSQTNVLCFGDSTGAIAINVVGGRLDYVFSWTGPNAFTSSNQNIDNLIAGIYNVTVTDDSNCTDTLQIEIIQNTEIAIDVTTTEIECYGDNDGSITINSISGGVGPYQVAWSNLGTGNSQTNLTGGTYTITITDAENCTKDFPIIIEEPAVFLIDPVVTQMSCSGENDASIMLNFVGGIAPINLVWNDDATAGTERNNLAPGTYTVTITDAAPCVIQESFTIFDISPLLVSANVTNALDCDDTNSGAINLLIEGGTPPFDVVWSNGETTEDLENSPPNSYTAQVTDANGCETTGSWTIERFEPLAVSVDIQSEVDCDAQTIFQTFIAQASGGVPPFTFTWSSGTVSGINNEQMTTTQNGLIILDVEDSLGCQTSYSFNVEIPVFGDPDFEVSSIGFTNYGIYSIHDPIQFTNTSTGNFESILWNFGDGTFSAEENPIHTYTAVGNYVVTQTVTYPFGCVYEHVVTLIIEEGYKLMFPDAFTPNEDSLNDFFVPKYIGLSDLEFRVYDTWGSLVFYEEDPESLIGWNGTINDELAENGNYYYTFSAKTFYDDAIEKDGVFVTIK